jgi:hypothetical protein
MRFFKRTLLLCVASLIVSAGCGGSGRAPLGKVTGTVNYRGEPVKSGTIILEVPGTRQATGKIVDGKITEVTTHDPNDGVPVGTAKIAVFATQAAAQGAAPATGGNPGSYKMDPNYMGSGAQSLIPAKYNNPATSGLTAEIKKGENTLTLDLKD